MSLQIILEIQFFVDNPSFFYIMGIAMNDTSKILISMAVFISAMFAPHAAAQTDMGRINMEIRATRDKIAAQRIHRDKMVRRMLERNSDYRHVTERAGHVRQLRAKNEELISRACDIVRSKNKSGMVLVAHSPMVFMLYSQQYSDIGSLRNLYEFNNREIKMYEKHLEKIDGLELRVKNHCDSIMHAEIDKYQLILDSLLNEKMKLIR